MVFFVIFGIGQELQFGKLVALFFCESWVSVRWVRTNWNVYAINRSGLNSIEEIAIL